MTMYELTLRLHGERQTDVRDVADLVATAIRRSAAAKDLGVTFQGWQIAAPVEDEATS